MSRPLPRVLPPEIEDGIARLREAAEARKCWGCGCLHGALESIEKSLPPDIRPPELEQVMQEARVRLLPQKYDCLGCEVCFPPLAMNALGVEAEACPSETVERREGWPPLPGSYAVLRYRAPVAVCTLTDENLAGAVARAAGPGVALVGNVYTENLGLERIVQNLLANPNVRFLVLCGADSRQAVGHLPGQSMLSLAAHGVDERSRIVGARGKRPMIKNLSRDAVEHFRRTVEVVDLLGVDDVAEILRVANDCAGRSPGPAPPFEREELLKPVRGYLPDRMVPDPCGYFVVYPDLDRGLLSLEHYGNDGVLRNVFEAATAAELYVPAVERGLLSRLDHAAYLGRELARAERALQDGSAYVQDAAPERRDAAPVEPGQPDPGRASGCGCGSSCGGNGR